MVFFRLLPFFLTLYFTTDLSWPDWLYFLCFFQFSLEYLHSFDHYFAFKFPLNVEILREQCSVNTKLRIPIARSRP